ncbi:MAG: hypothetical protein J6R22_04940 [Alphaproteobacteria bacterium]|nr:hypothetical protein [Alphaproteobacteria bacterium]
MKARRIFLLVLICNAVLCVPFAHANIASKSYVDAIVASINQKQANWAQTDSTASDYIANKPDIYTKTEIDDKLDNKADKSYVESFLGSSGGNVTTPDWEQTDPFASDYIANKPDIYTKTQLDTKLDTKADADDVRFSTVPTTEPSGTPPEGQVFIWFN